MTMDLKTLLEASEILFEKKYTLERTYSKEEDLIRIVYTIKEDYKKLLTTVVIGSYSIFDELIDYINNNTIIAFKNAVNRNK